jgi:hypothetical protein
MNDVVMMKKISRLTEVEHRREVDAGLRLASVAVTAWSPSAAHCVV